MSEEKKTNSYSEKDRIEAMDADFPTTSYQKDGQGTPRQGLKEDEEE